MRHNAWLLTHQQWGRYSCTSVGNVHIIYRGLFECDSQQQPHKHAVASLVSFFSHLCRKYKMQLCKCVWYLLVWRPKLSQKTYLTNPGSPHTLPAPLRFWGDRRRQPSPAACIFRFTGFYLISCLEWTDQWDWCELAATTVCGNWGLNFHKHKKTLGLKCFNSVFTFPVALNNTNALFYPLVCYVTKATAWIGAFPPTSLVVSQWWTPQPQKFAFSFTLNIFLAQLAIHISWVSVLKSLWSLKLFCLLSS